MHGFWIGIVAGVVLTCAAAIVRRGLVRALGRWIAPNDDSGPHPSLAGHDRDR